MAEHKAGTRLDKLLAEAIPRLSRTRVKALIEDGRVVLGDGPAREPARRVKAGQVFCVTVPRSRPAVPKPEAIPLDVVYEDGDLIVIDKPAGMVVHPAPGNPDGTLVNALLDHCQGSLSGIGGVTRPGIVHRLDKGTSGLMVAAKNDVAHRGLAEQFTEHSLDRAYYALLWGVPSPSRGEVSGNIGRHPVKRKKMAVVSRGGKWGTDPISPDRGLRPRRFLDGMPVGHGPHPPNSRAYGEPGPSGRRRSLVWRRRPLPPQGRCGGCGKSVPDDAQ